MPSPCKFITALIESPQSIPDDDFGASMDVHSQGVAAKLLPKARKVATVLGLPVYLDEPSGNLRRTYFSVSGDNVIFLAGLVEDEVPLLGVAAVLVALWRGPDAPPGLSGLVLWEVLLPRHRVMVSGPWPHVGTSKFWSDRLCEALDRGHRCGTVNTLRGSVGECRVKNEIKAGRFVEPGAEGEQVNERYFVAR